MTGTTGDRSTIRCATAVLALVMGLLSPAACGLGHTPSGHDGHPGPSYAIDTAPTTPQVVVHVRIHAHMGRPGVDERDHALD